MVNMQAKLALAFLGSTLVSVMIWDRGSRNGEPELAPDIHEHDLETYELTDEERIIHRSKRSTLSTSLHAIYKQFDATRDCCRMPDLLPAEALDACAPLKYRQKQKTGQRVVVGNGGGGVIGGGGGGVGGDYSGGWFRNVRSFFLNPSEQQQAAPAAKKRGKRQSGSSPDKIALPAVRYMDCVFSYLNLLNDTALDVVQAEETMVTSRMNTNWKDVVQNALYLCEEPSACATPSEVEYSRKYYSIKPTILMNCMKKQMLLNCPSGYRNKAYQCNEGIATMKKMNVFQMGKLV